MFMGRFDFIRRILGAFTVNTNYGSGLRATSYPGHFTKAKMALASAGHVTPWILGCLV